jgi:hypothetical protein
MKKQLLAGLAFVATLAHAQHPEPVAYPSNGQSAEQVVKDRDECRDWARNESGYTYSSARAMSAPRLPMPPGISPPPNVAVPINDVTFIRAMAACLEGRGYTVR